LNTLQNRHYITDSQWEKIKPIKSGKVGFWNGSNAEDNRIFINAVL